MRIYAILIIFLPYRNVFYQSNDYDNIEKTPNLVINNFKKYFMKNLQHTSEHKKFHTFINQSW